MICSELKYAMQNAAVVEKKRAQDVLFITDWPIRFDATGPESDHDIRGYQKKSEGSKAGRHNLDDGDLTALSQIVVACRKVWHSTLAPLRRAKNDGVGADSLIRRIL